jgi:hypothetical protein
MALLCGLGIKVALSLFGEVERVCVFVFGGHGWLWCVGLVVFCVVKICEVVQMYKKLNGRVRERWKFSF